MRLFVAVELDEAVRTAAADTARELERRLGDAVRARWVPATNMHLTVRFIGHVADDRVPPVLEALSPPLTIAPFDIELSGCGRFPPRGTPRVLWIGLTRGLPGLAALHDEFNRRLSSLGYEPEARAFSVHLTLARIKDGRVSAKDVDRTLAAVQTGSLKQSVQAATILESRLSPSGPRYLSLRELPLCS
jgi:2'-5' RNA ligase